MENIGLCKRDMAVLPQREALAASLFHFGQIRLKELKRYLADKGVPVREI